MTVTRAPDLIEAVPMSMLIVDDEMRVSNSNAAAREMFGETIQGRHFVTVLRHPGINEAVERLLKGQGENPTRLSAQISAQGRDVSVDATLTFVRREASAGVAVAFEDRTSLERAEQMRRDFVANVSHELRTPLTALSGFIETLRGPARNDQAARDRFLDIMDREASRMNRLIGDLLSLSRVESEERRRPAQSVDLIALLRNEVATLSPAAANAGVSLQIDLPEAPVSVAGDQDQLVQVFHNLIENAVKYGGSGGVARIEMTRLDHEPVLRGPAWAVAIIDNGEGIDARHLPRLTERFYRVDSHRSREQGGTGLGLAIVKHIVNRHRGRLRIESEKGQGSRFTVILPELSGKG